MKNDIKKLIALCLLGFSIIFITQKMYSGDPFAWWLESIVKYPYDVLYNPLFVAVHSQNLSKVEKLLKSGENPNQKDRYGSAPIIYAAGNENIAIIKLLLKYEANPNIKGFHNITPLEQAIQSGNTSVIDLLLQSGAKIIPLSEVIKHTRNAATIEKLFKEGASLDVSLHEIAHVPFLVQLLLEKGANPNERDTQGKTPLHHAASTGQIQNIALLLTAGADPNIRDKYGETPLYFVNNADSAQILIENGANVNQQDKFGNTPLHEATTEGHIQLIKSLMKNGADASIKNDAGMSALDIAIRRGNWKGIVTIRRLSRTAKR